MYRYIFILFFIFSCSFNSKSKDSDLTILAAISLKDMIIEIADNYKKDFNKNIVFSFAGSGTLRNQIELGIDSDLFFSASAKHIDILEDKDLIEYRSNFVENKIVLVSRTNVLYINNLLDITNANIKKIAIGDPATVPAGEYALEFFNDLKLFPTIKEKLVYGTDVRNVLTWVENNNVDCGIVYYTDYKLSDSIKVIKELETKRKIIYPLAILKNSKNKDEAKKFLDYLYSDSSIEIIKKYGFYPIGI